MKTVNAMPGAIKPKAGPGTNAELSSNAIPNAPRTAVVRIGVRQGLGNPLGSANMP